jgi:cell wall-associated NlpC family hydrolase
VTSSYSQFLSSLVGRAAALNRLSTGVVVGAVAFGAVVAGSVTVAAAPSSASAAVAATRSNAGTSGADRAVGREAASTATAGAVISLAEKQVGIRADASGETKFQQWYTTTPDARNTARRDGGAVKDYIGAEWCDMFVSWVGAQTGVKDMGRDAYTVDHAKWFQKIKRWGEKPKPGALVFYAWNGGGTDGISHVGLVVRDNGNGTITTVEGNTSGDAVAEKVRSTSQVVGYGYPQYVT